MVQATKEQSSRVERSASSASSRRSSFLSKSMRDSESVSIYDSYTFSRGPSSYSIISLKESQGFLFNQDLFATPYQQSRTLALEKRARSHSSSKARRSKSHSNSARWVTLPSSHQRRHTSYDCASPQLRIVGAESVIEEDSGDDMCVDGDSRPKRPEDQSGTTLERLVSGISEANDQDALDVSENESSDNSDNEDSMEYNSMSSYRVPVIDIIVDDKDETCPEI